jgi:hypothetical protein
MNFFTLLKSLISNAFDGNLIFNNNINLKFNFKFFFSFIHYPRSKFQQRRNKRYNLGFPS